MPVSATEDVPPLALCVTESVAARLPVAAGVKPTTSVQALPAATVAPDVQVPVLLKSAALVPLKDTVEIDKGPVPVFESVAVCAAALVAMIVPAKLSEEGDTLAPGVSTTLPAAGLAI